MNFSRSSRTSGCRSRNQEKCSQGNRSHSKQISTPLSSAQSSMAQSGTPHPPLHGSGL